MTTAAGPKIRKFELACGMPLLVERHEGVRSAGLTWLLPFGSACDDRGRVGASAMMAEWLWRGAGGLDARAHSEALDRVGLQRSSSVGTHHLRIGAVVIGSRLAEAMPLITSMVTAPGFEDATFEPVRDLTIQAIESLKDDPQQQSMLMVKERHFPPPFNRSGLGEAEDLAKMTAEGCRELWRKRVRPVGAILGLAGDVDGEAAAKQLDQELAGWTGRAEEMKEEGPAARGYKHIKDETAQVHIALAHAAPPEPDRMSMHERIAVSVLSGGMSGRLFTEVREKRSLCYSVYASYSAGRDRGAVLAYTGTTPEKAQQSLDVTMGELKRIAKGVDEEEFRRAVVGLKSRLVMQGESTSARAAAIVHDWYVLGRARTLEEAAGEVERVTLESLNRYLSERSAPSFTVVTIGPGALTPPPG